MGGLPHPLGKCFITAIYKEHQDGMLKPTVFLGALVGDLIRNHLYTLCCSVWPRTLPHSQGQIIKKAVVGEHSALCPGMRLGQGTIIGLRQRPVQFHSLGAQTRKAL